MSQTSDKQFVHRARKRFGQNFLHDQNIIQRIIKAVNPMENQALIEIGPGQGAITKGLLALSKTLDVIEVDRDLAAMLRQQFGDYQGFTLHQGDVLKFDFNQIPCPEGGFRILGNLPYNISTPLLFHLLQYHQKINDMTFMLQLEVVNRMAAKVNEKNYGRLGIMMQYYCQVEKLFKVPSTAFQPMPKVDSAIVRLKPYKTPPIPAKNTEQLEKVVRVAFSQRRKTIRNSLKVLISATQLESLDINSKLRPENICLEEYVRISDFLELN